VFFIGASDGYFNASEQDDVPGSHDHHPNMGKGYEGPKQQNSLKLGAAEVLQLELLELKYPKPPLWNCPSKLWPCSRGLAYSNPITRKICLVLFSHKQLLSVLHPLKSSTWIEPSAETEIKPHPAPHAIA
jgi:hypothetical protein